jgi:hypothetical protein
MSERPIRRMGRPPLDTRHPSIPISVRIPVPQYDALCKRAQRDHVSVADALRQQLHAIADDDE